MMKGEVYRKRNDTRRGGKGCISITTTTRSCKTTLFQNEKVISGFFGPREALIRGTRRRLKSQERGKKVISRRGSSLKGSWSAIQGGKGAREKSKGGGLASVGRTQSD